MIIGRYVCSTCGCDCTSLYGFAMQKRSSLTRSQLEEFDRVLKEFGQSEFVFCWSCTAKAFGAKTLAEKDVTEQAKPDLPSQPKELTKKPFKEKINGINDR